MATNALARDAAYADNDGTLPPPVSMPNGTRPHRPLVRIVRPSLRVHWAKIKQKFGTASAPSESILDGSTTEASSHANPTQRVTQTAEKNGESKEPLEGEAVDVIVVERDFHLNGTETAPSTIDRSSKSGHSHSGMHGPAARPHGAHTGQTERSSLMSRGTSLLSRLVPRPALAGMRHFFDMGSELQPEVENQYRKEQWHLSKRIALMSSLFFVVNWILAVAFIPRPETLPDIIFYYAITPIFTFPLPFMVAWNLPRDNHWLFQTYIGISTWCWSAYNVIYMNICGFVGTPSRVSCNGKEFLGVFYFTTALPTIALFALHQNRICAVTSSVAFLIIMLITVVPHQSTMARQTVNFVAYQAFLLYIHFKKESSDRRLYHMREELKNQYRATQKAQVAERKASDSKRRLTSYIFHEVRVPLNTALLATQNMEAGGAVPLESEIEFRALQGSLSMMSKVLNDVLDFNRMDAGRFESVSRPYSLHTALRSMFSPMKLAAEAKGLTAILELDSQIDIVARAAALGKYGEDGVVVADGEKDGEPGEDQAANVIGDEMRLRQIINNLTSNATKFTPSGGTIKIVTKLIHPEDGRPLPPGPGGTGNRIVVRIEVHDTGVGIRARDLVDGGRRLFSPYVQTEIGRVQGGKGSGLGLALVRHIVRLSHGRLGVRSRVGAMSGSVFWVELSFGVGPEALSAAPLGGVSREMETGASEGAHAMSEGSSGGMMFPVVRKATDGAGGTSGIAEFERAMLARRPDPVLGDPPSGNGTAAALLRSTTRRSITRRPTFDHEPTMSTLPSTTMPAASSPWFESIPSSQPTPTDIRPSLPHRTSSGRSILKPSAIRSMNIPPPTTMEPPPLHDLTPTALSSIGMTAYFPTMTPPGSAGLPQAPPFAHRNSGLPNSDLMSAPQKPSTPPPTSSFVPTSITGQPLTSGPPSPTTATTLNLTTTSGAPSAMPTADRSVVPNRSAGSLTSMGAVAASPREDRRMRVLVVDDDGLTRRLMGRMLARLGCVVDTAEHGQQALDMMLMDPNVEEPYACTFLDNQMHVMSGLEMIIQLRELGRKDFVVGVTGNALLADQEEYLGAGVDHVLTKPVMEQSLKMMLATAHDRRRSLQRRNRPPDDAAPDLAVEHPSSAPDSPSADQEAHTLSHPPGLGNGSALPSELKASS